MRKSEYVIDRLQAEIQHYKDIADAYEREYKVLKEECRFGAAVALMFGIALGIAAGTAIAWQG